MIHIPTPKTAGGRPPAQRICHPATTSQHEADTSFDKGEGGREALSPCGVERLKVDGTGVVRRGWIAAIAFEGRDVCLSFICVAHISCVLVVSGQIS